MEINSLHQDLIDFLSDLKEEEVLQEVHQLLERKEPPLRIFESCQKALKLVGQNFERGYFYLSGLMMAGEIMCQVSEMLKPVLKKSIHGKSCGRILLGTVQGDIHDIGKNLVAVILQCHGFEVADLGVDVPSREFLKEAHAFGPHVFGLSGLLTVSFDTMRETVSVLRSDMQRRNKPIPIIVGGGLINEEIRQYVGADYWAPDAMSAVKICHELMPLRS